MREKSLFDIIVTLRKRKQEEEDGTTDVCDNRNRAITCVFVVIFILHQCFPFVFKKTCSKEVGVWRKDFTNKIIVTQRLVSSFLSRPAA